MSGDLERQEDKALRDKIAQRVDHALFHDIGGYDGPELQRISEFIADAVLPVVKAHQEALADEPASHVIRRAIRSAAEARTELQSLREAVAHLADQLDDDVQAIVNKDAGALGRRGGLRDAARRLRSLLPQEGTQQ